jgi:hypothetical protein
MKVTVDLYCIRATTAEIRIKNTSSERITSICVFSFICFATVPLIKSIVIVELEAITSAARVDIEADSTRITTIPTSKSGRVEIIAGIILSNITAPLLSYKAAESKQPAEAAQEVAAACYYKSKNS